MNRTVLCLALAAMPFLSFAQKDCRVEGKANPEQVGRYVYIVYGNQITDSVKVNKNAEFSFALKADDKLYTCAEYGGRDVLAFVSEKGKVELNLRDMSCKGGELNKEVSLFNSASKEAWKGYEKRAAEIKAKAVSEAEKEKEQDALYEETIKSLQKTAEETMSRISDKEAAGWMLASLSYYYSLENFFKQYDRTRAQHQLSVSEETLQSTVQMHRFLSLTVSLMEMPVTSSRLTRRTSFQWKSSKTRQLLPSMVPVEQTA